MSDQLWLYQVTVTMDSDPYKNLTSQINTHRRRATNMTYNHLLKSE